MAKYNLTEKKEKEAAYRTLVSPKLMDELEEKINDIVLIHKKYKDKNYSAKRLAEDLGTNTRYISAVVNVRFHMNYTSFVNQYRIREAMSLLVDKRYQGLNMEDISDMVGFSNRQSFYASFYKLNGCTPRDYKIRHLAQHPSLTEKPHKRGRRPGSKNKAKSTTEA
ncbi:helix-turn-helix domain-containing protein [Prevotella sp. kh1p2]|jgi:AraC-like DNA-binding protein|uniref:helix-turn-helix domain-containing protein n=1 Tax=Prevotella sp. kh1p2 TaxID=1761883 RepID=UPI0008D23F9D|nr:helix-turn-helix domain-containing protein [Prevotella sp. kh1p2]SET18817.1 Helix-turn-helix domain-containing protein [Prevotella sp. kh1p2]SNU12188.1 Helix-turn-helix domain-containing protein [Prevotellaceae bacterium KH2P17]